MILDSGICSIFSKRDVSGRGEKPRFAYDLKAQSYYGELDFASGGTWTTQGREDVQVDARIRIHQDRSVTAHDVVVLKDVDTAKGEEIYEIDRIYHGRDDESGELISDLTLRKVSGR